MATERFCPDCLLSFAEDMQFCPDHGKPLVVMDNLDDELSKQVGKDIDGRYRITGVLGRGGMGMVFRAKQTSIDRDVALKVLRPIFSRDATAVKRFFREAKLASRINHPNTVTIFDFARSDTGLLYISMEYVEGQPLDALLQKEGPLSWERALGIVSYITDSLGDAHENELVHRDLKPSNIIIQQRFGKPDFARVLDFGIAKTLDAGSGQETLTAMGMVCGTPAYMSPEQTMGSEIDGRSDIFSLGCILYELISGKRIFEGASPMEVMAARHSKDFHTVLKESPLDIPEDVLKLLKAMTCRDVQKRLSAVDLRQWLSDLGYGVGSTTNVSGQVPVAQVDRLPDDFLDRSEHAFGATVAAVDTADTQMEQPLDASQFMETSPSPATEGQPASRTKDYRLLAIVGLALVVAVASWWLWSDPVKSLGNDPPVVEVDGSWLAGTDASVVGAATPLPITQPSPRLDSNRQEVFGTASREKDAGVLTLVETPAPEETAQPLARLSDGTRVTVLSRGHGTEQRWWHVRVETSRASGLVGYVLHQWLRPLPDVEVRPLLERGSRAVRRGPSMTAPTPTSPNLRKDKRAGKRKPGRRSYKAKKKPKKTRRSGKTPDGDEIF